jgi:hypothetical protein
LAPPTIPGVRAEDIFLYGPMYLSMDMAVQKMTRITERAQFVIQSQFINAFNHPVFGVGTTNITSTSFGQTSSTMVGPRNIQIRAFLQW